MRKTLRKKFILFAMTAVTILLVVLIGAINGVSWLILERQSDAILHAVTSMDGGSGRKGFYEQHLFAPPMNLDTIKSARLWYYSIYNPILIS